jgi:SAM-dependent methyltransferase
MADASETIEPTSSTSIGREGIQRTDLEDAVTTTDSAGEDSDSAWEEQTDLSNYTASLISQVKDYAYENGRRYHSYRQGEYVLPNDEQEQDRQDLLHHVRNLTLKGALYHCPLPTHPQRVLDIGTGTGIWAIDFADMHPSAEVIGTDLSPIQPPWVPPNLQFYVEDAESTWLYNRRFDFIHCGDLGGSIGNWPELIKQVRNNLRPGGWFELHEFEVTLKSDDDTLKLAPSMCEFLHHLARASEMFNKPMNVAEGHKQFLLDAGFEYVQEEIYKVCQMHFHMSTGLTSTPLSTPMRTTASSANKSILSTSKKP